MAKARSWQVRLYLGKGEMKRLREAARLAGRTLSREVSWRLAGQLVGRSVNEKETA